MNLSVLFLSTILFAQSSSLPTPNGNGDYFYTVSGSNSYLRGLVWTVKADKLNCRNNAGINQPAIQVLQQGRKIGAPADTAQPFVRDKQGQSWMKVFIPQGKVCYVRANSKFIQPAYIESL